MKKTVGIIFSNLNDSNIADLTEVRTTGSIPYGGRYRLIDFVLSSMVNSQVTKVGVITKYNYQSLMDHIGTGKEWDLARKNGGLILLPPYGDKGNNALYKSRIEALKGIMHFIESCKEEYVILSDCDVVYNIDFTDVLDFHEKKDAEITMVYHKANIEPGSTTNIPILKVDENDLITDLQLQPSATGDVNQYVKVLVMKKVLLQNIVRDAIAHGRTDFLLEILYRNLKYKKTYGYECKGFCACISSLKDYFKASLDLLEKETRDSLFEQPSRAIYTKVKDSPPTLYGENAQVINSFIADGCVIEGRVENSIIFRGTKIKKDAVVKNSIIMQNNYVGEKAEINALITDKNVVIKEKRVLSGCPEVPYYIKKNTRL